MGKRLPKTFFLSPADKVAPRLLGKILVRKIGSKERRMIIVETEAYGGSDDLASHARFGKTGRSRVMFGEGGYWYVYLVYGMHWLLNVVTGISERPSAVLIRAGVMLPSGEMLKGPGAITDALRIGKNLNEKICGKKSGLWIEEGSVRVKSNNIIRLHRVGVAYSGSWAKKPWRFVLMPEAWRG